MMVDHSNHAHGWPVVVLAVSAVAIGVAALHWSKSRNNAVPRHKFELPCLLDLLEALREQWERIQLEFVHSDSKEWRDWNEYVDTLCKKLHAVKKELARMKDTPTLDTVAKVIDNELVEFLRLESAVMSILDGHLPRPGQTWDDLFQTKSEDERHFYISKILCTDEGREELVQILIDLINELGSILEQSRCTDVGRAIDDDQAEKVVYKIVKIWFATDRVVTVDAEYLGKRSKREDSLQYGFVEVAIPCTHEIGKSEAPNAEEADPSKHIMIFAVATNLRGDLPQFLECINNDLTSGGEVLVYIHGYNTSHLKAVKQAAQLKHDLDFKGPIILYSWSTCGTFSGYVTDEKTVRETTDSLHELLKSIMNNVKAARVHIVAHSMGNRALIGALDKLLDDVKEAGRPCLGYSPLSQIVFVAADEERSRFLKLAQKVKETYTSMLTSPSRSISPADSDSTSSANTSARSISATSFADTSGSFSLADYATSFASSIQPHLSVYCSTEDRALRTSRLLHGWKYRLGDTRSLLNSEASNNGDHDVIDTTDVDQGTSKYYHSYHLQYPKVIYDMQILLTRCVPASDSARSCYLHRIEKNGKTFYAFEKASWN